MDDLELDLVRGESLERFRQRFHGALDIRLEDEPQLLDLARLDLLVQSFQGNARGRPALGLLLLQPHGRDLSGLALVGHGDEDITGGRHAGEPENLHGIRRPCRLDLLSCRIDESADTPGVAARHDGVAFLERPVLDEGRGHGPAPAVESALDDDALGGAVGAGLQLQHLGL